MAAFPHQIKSFSHRHEAIFQWMIANPHRPLVDCALALGYSHTWVLNIVHSDMFQAKLREYQDKVGETLMADTVTQLRTLARLSLDRQIKMLETGQGSERFLVDSSKTALAALGYLTPQAQVQEHFHLHATIDAEALRQARDRALNQASNVTPPAKILDTAPGGDSTSH